jgi:hypothetical protein
MRLTPIQFQGKQIYGTICETCGYRSERNTDFLEIEINFDASHFISRAVFLVIIFFRMTLN